MRHFWKNLNNRGRILLLLMSTLILLNTIVLVTTYSLKSLSESFTSILNDRLVPSTELAFIQGYCYQNRLYLEDDLVSRTKNIQIDTQIKQNNQQIESTLNAYKKSYFTEEESLHVARFTEILKEYRSYEQEILAMLANNQYEQARQVFYGKSQQAFSHLVRELQLLSGIQLSVGKTLYEHTGETILIIKTVAYCSLCISLIVAAHLLIVLGVKPNLVNNRP